MTLNGAIMELVLLSEHPMMPVIFRPAIQKVIETISELEAQPKQRWVPVTERLPKKQTQVLVVDFDEVDTAYLNSEGRWMDFNGDKLKDVKAWMPMPKWEGDAE